MAHLEGGSVVEPSDLLADRLNDRLAAMASVAAPKPGHGEQPTAVGGVIMHALGAIDQPRTPLEGAIGGEGESMG